MLLFHLFADIIMYAIVSIVHVIYIRKKILNYYDFSGEK